MKMPTREPLAVRAALIAMASAVLQTLVAFGVPLTADQQASVSTLVNVTTILMVVLWSRGTVTPLSDPRASDGTPLTPDEQDY